MKISDFFETAAQKDENLILSFLLVHLGNVLENSGNKNIFSKFEITATYFNILTTLNAAKKPLSPSDFSGKIITSAANVSGILRRMEAQNLISRKINPEHKRAVLISLEKKGKEILKKCNTELKKLTAKKFEKLSDEEKTALICILKKLSK